MGAPPCNRETTLIFFAKQLRKTCGIKASQRELRQIQPPENQTSGRNTKKGARFDIGRLKIPYY